MRTSPGLIAFRVVIVVILLTLAAATYGTARAHASGSAPTGAAIPAGYGEGAGFCKSIVSSGSPLNSGNTSYDKVYPCGPEPGGSYPSYGDAFQDGGGFQCTELANRFLFDVWGRQPVFGSSLDGKTFAQTVHADYPSVPLVTNGTAGQPYLPGDIVSFSGNSKEPDGHVAVVIASAENGSGNGSVTIMEENAAASGKETLTVRNWTLLAAAGSYVTPYEFDALAASASGTDDIIATERHGTNAVKYMIGENDGTGLNYNYTATNLVNNTEPTQVAAGDLNGDGRTDILATEPADQQTCPGGVTYMVGLSNGNGTFNWERTNLVCDTAPTHVAVGDVQGNGRMDIIATEPSCPGGVRYMIGYNDGSGLNYDWGGTNLTCNAPPTQLALADMNGDGKADIVATEPACPGGVRYMVGMSNGNGTFNWDFTNLTCDTTPTHMAVGDVQRNGRMDIITTEPHGTNAVKYMIGENDGSGLNYNYVATNLVNDTAPTQMTLGDMNGDGKADIVATEPACPGGVRYMVGMSNGNGTFNWDPTSLTCDTTPYQVVVGHFRG
jgi:FG-GAP-like repeat/CHAP domain